MMVLLFATIYVACISFTERPFDYGGLVPLFEYSVALLCLALYLWHMLRRRIVIDVTDEDVLLQYVSPANRVRTMSWHRRDITELRASDINHRLVIRATGREMQETYLGSDEITRQVAAKLQEALQASFAAPSPTESFKNIGTPFAEAQLTVMLFRISYAAFAIGALVLVVRPGWGAAMLLVAASIFTLAAGIRHGEQEKFFT
jgi:hypothetical protein